LASDPGAAFLLLGFGGPEGPDDVLPFLRQVTAGRGVPDERLLEVAGHYQHLGGVSPINRQNEALLAAVTAEFAAHHDDLPTYWGNRNWRPWLADTVAQMAADGIERAYVLATSATGGYSGCRQYREDLARARAEVGAGAPELIKIRHFFNHPGFVAANADRVRTALAGTAADARLVFTAHSIPFSMDAAAGPEGHLYSIQQRETARLVAEAVRGSGAEFDIVWQSRSGPPQVPWLEPDVNDHLRALAEQEVRSVVLAPTGFVSDHVEVIWDLDNEAQATAADVGITLVRAATVGTHPSFVAAVRELVEERRHGRDLTPARAAGALGPSWDECPLERGCCAPPVRRAG
jgi:ferrochelatase